MQVFEKNIQRLTILIFIIILCLPLINKRLQLMPDVEGNENRNLSEKPKFEITNLDFYFSAFDNYFSDNFSLRQQSIKWLTNLEFDLFQVSPLPKEVIIGKQGWFYSYNDAINYRATNLFTADQLEALKDELLKRSKWVKEQNATYYIVVVPTNPNIYSEFLPNYIKRKNNITRYDQIQFLDGVDGINIINIRDTILANKNGEHYLYQKTDGHWNELGAYYGYKAIIDRLAKDINPQLTPIPLSNYTIKQRDGDGAFTRMINLEHRFRESYVYLEENFEPKAVDGPQRPYPKPDQISDWDAQIIKTNPQAKPFKCLVIRDSFGLYLMKFFKDTFQETVMIHDAWKYMLNEEIVLNEKPDIVLNVIFENNVDRLLQYPCNK